jgi:hypothetical protein
VDVHAVSEPAECSEDPTAQSAGIAELGGPDGGQNRGFGDEADPVDEEVVAQEGCLVELGEGLLQLQALFRGELAGFQQLDGDPGIMAGVEGPEEGTAEGAWQGAEACGIREAIDGVVDLAQLQVVGGRRKEPQLDIEDPGRDGQGLAEGNGATRVRPGLVEGTQGGI